MNFFAILWGQAMGWLKKPFFSISVRFYWTGDKEPDVTPRFKSPGDFLEALRPDALGIEGETGIPWIFAVTQAAHESRYGNSDLAIEANNLFGVTAEGHWQNSGLPVYQIITKEFDAAGKPYEEKRPFRRYANFNECLQDWASIITRLYPKALAAARQGDFTGFANGLMDGIPDDKGRPLRYASDPQYVQAIEKVHAVLEATV
jgi:flagellum-specific peptidoglycan hydrolase FlgJ